jgi:hypothetical protein
MLPPEELPPPLPSSPMQRVLDNDEVELDPPPTPPAA